MGEQIAWEKVRETSRGKWLTASAGAYETENGTSTLKMRVEPDAYFPGSYRLTATIDDPIIGDRPIVLAYQTTCKSLGYALEEVAPYCLKKARRGLREVEVSSAYRSELCRLAEQHLLDCGYDVDGVIPSSIDRWAVRAEALAGGYEPESLDLIMDRERPGHFDMYLT